MRADDSGRAGMSAVSARIAAFAVVVGPEDERQVPDRDDEDQRPEDERKHPEDVRRASAAPSASRKALVESVKRARADVAVDDAERREDDCRATPVVRTVSQISSGFSYITRRRGPPAALQVWPQGPLARRHRIPRSVWRREIYANQAVLTHCGPPASGANQAPANDRERTRDDTAAPRATRSTLARNSQKCPKFLVHYESHHCSGNRCLRGPVDRCDGPRSDSGHRR